MRSFLRVLFRRKSTSPAAQRSRLLHIMSGSSTSAILYAATVAAPNNTAARPNDEITASKAWHTSNGRFSNPWESWRTLSAWNIMSAMIGRRFTGKANVPDTAPPTVPVVKPTFLKGRQQNDKLRATWLGHACYYVEFPSGLRVLFDPVFTDRCSPFSFLGPKRYTEMPCKIADIPIIDAVVISHNHYDHLSHPTIMEIAQRHPNTHFFVPLGNKKWFTACGVHQCTELDWWDEVDFTLTAQPAVSAKGQIPSVSSAGDQSSPPDHQITSRVSCLPCQHTSNRGLTDRAATLWSSWSVTSGGKSLWFGGDTGYRAVPQSSDGQDDWAESYSHLPTCPVFKDIGKLRGPFDLGLIPIGAYMPRWIMSPMHANPRDAVEIFRDTACKRALGIHWGTWVLTEEDVLEPPRLLRKALAHHAIPETGVFDVCDIGESREI